MSVKIFDRCSSSSSHRLFYGSSRSSSTFNITNSDLDDDLVDEVQLLSSLRHDNIVRLIGVSLSRRPFYLVTEMSRSSLGRLDHFLIDHFDENSPQQLLYICRQATEALKFLELQRRPVVHRNVSAASFEVSTGLSNCHCVEDVVIVQLTDFGRAKVTIDDEYIGDIDETILVKWAAPEVLINSHYSTKSDVWALAVVFWEVSPKPF